MKTDIGEHIVANIRLSAFIMQLERLLIQRLGIGLTTTKAVIYDSGARRAPYFTYYRHYFAHQAKSLKPILAKIFEQFGSRPLHSKKASTASSCPPSQRFQAGTPNRPVNPCTPKSRMPSGHRQFGQSRSAHTRHLSFGNQIAQRADILRYVPST